MKNIATIYILISLSPFFISCLHSQKKIQINESSNNLLELKLTRAKESGNIIDICNIYLRQGEDKSRVYKILKDSIMIDNSICYEVSTNQTKYINRRYSDALIRHCNKCWNEIYNMCSKYIDQIELYHKQEQRNEDWERILSHHGINQENLDLELITKLDTIHFDDQVFRNSIDPYNHYEDWENQKQNDSLNYLKILPILKKYGYPKIYQTGYKHKTTLWLVLHHQSEINKRISNRKFIEQGLANGALNESHLKLYDDRTARYQKKSKD